MPIASVASNHPHIDSRPCMRLNRETLCATETGSQSCRFGTFFFVSDTFYPQEVD
jgi:hypothetical protein